MSNSENFDNNPSQLIAAISNQLDIEIANIETKQQGNRVEITVSLTTDDDRDALKDILESQGYRVQNVYVGVLSHYYDLILTQVTHSPTPSNDSRD